MAKIIFNPTEKYSYHEELDPETNRKYIFQKQGEYDVPDFICDILISRLAYKGIFSLPLTERIQNFVEEKEEKISEVVDSFVSRIKRSNVRKKEDGL